MELFGLSITRTKQQSAAVPITGQGRLWWPLVREPFAGAWQQNQEETVENITAHVAVFACVSLIASDLGKMRPRLVAKDSNGIWTETENPAWSPLLRKPNSYETRQQFFERWQVSKLLNGNTYILKRRDGRNVVDAMYILDPCRVRVFMAPDTSVYYELTTDNIAGLPEKVMVPAREIIHDRYIALFHPLIGVSPIYACGRAALQGLTIQTNSTAFFANGSQPSGVLTAPGAISQPSADRIKAKWEDEFGGDNVGKVAVLGDGLKYEATALTSVDSQLIEQLKFTAEMICTAFRVPPSKIAVGPMPSFNNAQMLDLQYYSQCLQEKIEKVETLLDEGQELPAPFGVEFDLDDLLRMDTLGLITSEKEAAGIKQLNESRKRLNLPPVKGGDVVFVQQQNWSVEALNRRDQAPPPTPDTPAALPPPEMPPEPAPEKAIDWAMVKAYTMAHAAEYLVKQHAP